MVEHELGILRHDPLPFVISFAFPLLLMAFLKPAFAASLRAAGFVGANGAEQAVPGMALMFAMFLISNVGFGFLREYDWRTWDRLRLTRATPSELIIGKLVPGFCITAGLMGGLLVIGGVVYGLDVKGPIAGLGLVVVTAGLWMTATGALVATVCTTAAQATAIANLITLAFAGFGGVFTPIDTLPGWARAIAPATPTYWLMSGFSHVIEGRGLTDVFVAVVIVLAMTTVTGIAAVFRLRHSTRRP
jgi:ABC-2 type transport system permease protein